MHLRAGLAMAITGSLLMAPSMAAAAERHERLALRAPAGIYVGTSQGRFLLRRSGSETRLSDQPWRQPSAPRLPRGWIDVGRHEFAHMRDGHLVITREGETVWQSTNRFHVGNHARLWDVQVWGQGVAYQVRRKRALYASLGGCPERR